MLRTLTTADETALNEIAEEKRIRKTNEVFLLFALGSQFDHLIKMQLDKIGVFCLVANPATVSLTDVQKVKPIGMVLSGGPSSAHSEPPPFDAAIFNANIPILGICLGFQMWASHIGIAVTPGTKGEYSTHTMTISKPSMLFEGLPDQMAVLESHGDIVDDRLNRMDILANTANAPAAAARFNHLWGVQFHPEVTETLFGPQIFDNFCFKICGAKDRYPAADVAGQKIAELREQIGNRKILLALSGGSDSSTVAYLLKQSIQGRPGQVRAIYIKGIDRPNDEAHVQQFFGNQPWLDLKTVDAADPFLDAVAGCEDDHAKRVVMRGVYKDILEEEAHSYDAAFIAQGSLYTDISESGYGYETNARKAQIKIHHNVSLKFDLPELTPLADCVKDTARSIGRAIGVPEVLLARHPFPGPGLLIRIEGTIDRSKLNIARQVDGIFIEELRQWNLYDTVWQACADLTASRTTCTKGDNASFGPVVELKAYWSVNGFTAQAAELPWDFMKHVSRRITNEVSQVGGVSFNVSDKPPRTIERG